MTIVMMQGFEKGGEIPAPDAEHLLTNPVPEPSLIAFLRRLRGYSRDVASGQAMVNGGQVTDGDGTVYLFDIPDLAQPNVWRIEIKPKSD